MTALIVKLTWKECRERAVKLTNPDDFRAHNRKQKVYGVPRGGVLAALCAPAFWELVDHPAQAELIVDDIIASGHTRELYRANYPETPFVALVDKSETGHDDKNPATWYQFPWEVDETPAEENVRRVLQAIGENPDRAGLIDTPKRFVKALREMTAGLHENPREHLRRTFPLDDVDDAPSAYDDIILSRGLDFVSLCEHHLLPFSGVAHIGYLPSAEGDSKRFVVGLSKLGRMLDGYAKRPQVQERLTRQVADAVMEELSPQGVGVVIRAQHTCQCFRGVRKQGEMITSAMLGCFRDQPSARAELLSLITV